MIAFATELYKVLNLEQKRRFQILQTFVIISSAFELLSILSIAPFMAAVSNKNLEAGGYIIQQLHRMLGGESVYDFLTRLGFVILPLLITSSILNIYTIRKLSSFAADIGAEFGNRLYINYISKNYLFHTSVNSADLIGKIANEVNRVTDNILQPIVQINARLISIAIIGVFLFVYNPFVSIIALLTMTATYLILFRLARAKLSIYGQLISQYSKERIVLMNEGFGSIKEIQILGRKNFFIKKFVGSGNVYAMAYGGSNSLFNTPRYVLELILYSSMIGIVVYLLRSNNGDPSGILPVVSVFGLSSVKLIPAFQQIYSGAAQIKNNMSAFLAINEDLFEAMDYYNDAKIKVDSSDNVNGDIELVNINFTYPGKAKPALNDVTLSIKRNSSIGIVGPSGSGKSTLLDVLIGALSPDSGILKVGSKKIDDDSLAAWQKNIGYVSQSPVLKDGTVSENIAFGLDEKEIKPYNIVQAAQQACLIPWINSLPERYDTRIGERGAQISGGQRQRIAIARALYRNADYLFLDEATSSLDGDSELSIMEAIESMAGQKTIIIVAHRLNTVKHCDRIFLIADGVLHSSGTYDSLWANCETFRNLVGKTVE
jgi:ABC-type multidrug transport system fused ATPase/permease subunit